MLISESQNIFRFEKDGISITKGKLTGVRIEFLYATNPKLLKSFLNAVYNHPNSNRHTKKVVIDICKTLRIDFSLFNASL